LKLLNVSLLHYDLQYSMIFSIIFLCTRGLLLPKIIVEEYGGSRTDAGMLGSGIYFASDPL